MDKLGRRSVWMLVGAIAITIRLLALTPLAAAGETSEATPAPELEHTALPAADRQETLMRVPSFGRYAIILESSQGTGLQLVDRMAGPGPVVGEAGERDGRLDVFLDRGEYKVVTHGHERASGEVRIEVRAFAETSAEPLELADLKLIAATLGDFEQVSYWLHVAKRRRVAIEAAGRHLHDLRLWQNGSWLVDARPESRVIEPYSGRPLLLCQLTADLNPGLYRLTAYGGESQPWSDDGGDERPLYLRSGIPTVGEAGRARRTLSPFGFDRFLVPGGATYFRIELPEARPARLAVGWFEPGRPFVQQGDRRTIDKESLPPVAELSRSANREKLHRVEVTAEAGQAYTLQHFHAARRYGFKESGPHWISTVHSGHPGDSIDPTAMLVRNDWQRHARPVEAEVIEVGPERGWVRRCNLLDSLNVHLRVAETGKYEIHGQGIAARFRVEPFLLTRPRGYEPPPYQESGFGWELDAGYYVLTVEPVRKGIVTIVVRPHGWLDSVLEMVGLADDEAGPAEPVQASVRFPSVALDDDYTYTLFLNRQPDVEAGVVLRRLPLDLTDPLPLTQRPEEIVEVPFQVSERGRLRATAEDDSLLEVSVDEAAWSRESWVGPGNHRLRIRHRGERTAVYSLALVPESLLEDRPLTPLPPETLAALPEFPVLTDRGPRRFDLKRQEEKVFLVRADEPALYRLETTGLLATEGNLRTRVVTSLMRQAANGVGRNFLVQLYLREGDYQIAVRAQGESAGHLGLELARTAVRDGGRLRDGVPARGFLPAGEAVAYRFRIDEQGDYRLRTLGVGRTFRTRLEDAGGWPLTDPAVEADLTHRFRPGEYRLIVLPETVSARQLTVVEPIPDPLRYTGHGPHPLPLECTVEHRWHEPAEGDERRPDVWRFSLPAPIDARIVLTQEMHGDLFRMTGTGAEKAAYVPPQRGWEGELAAGEYELRTTCVRVNNRVDYSLSVWSQQLVAGLSRGITVPASVPVSVGAVGEGQAALVELSSFGAADVRAQLYAADGRLVAANDDRPGDWNFLLTERLAAGRYTLRVDPVGSAKAKTVFWMRRLEESEELPLALPVDEEIALEGAVRTYPLTLPAGAEVLAIAARSSESIGVSLEQLRADGWRTLGTRVGPDVRIEMPLRPLESEPGDRYRLRLWSLDQRGNPVNLQAWAGAVARVDEAQLERGLELGPPAGSEVPVGLVAVETEQAGCFVLASETGLRFATRPQTVAGAVAGPVPAAGELLWLAADLDAGGRRRVEARRTAIEPAAGEPFLLRLPAGVRATCDLRTEGPGPVVVRGRTVVGDLALALRNQPGELPVGEEIPCDQSMTVSRQAAVAVILGAREPRVTAWSGSAEDEELELRLEAWAFADPPAEPAGWGGLEGELDQVAVRVFMLPAGEKRLRLALDPSIVAVLSHVPTSATGALVAPPPWIVDDALRCRGVATAHWADRRPGEEIVESVAERLTIFHLDSGSARFRIEILPVDERDRLHPPEPGRPFERRMTRAGTVRLRLPPAAGYTVHARGVEEATLLGADGSIARGGDLAVPAGGGTLLLRHRPGVVLSWLDRADEEIPGLWGDAEPAPAQVVELPAVVPLSGRVEVVEIRETEPIMLHLRSATPMVTWLTGRPAPAVEVHPEGAVVDAYLPGGSVRLGLRALGTETLDGAVELTTSRVVPISEGLGPEILLAAGETRIFSFTVERAAAVGVGVRAGADVVETVLLDAGGRRLGEGVVQMHDLDPGPYLLTLTLPATAPPVRVRPVVVGLEPPGTGPPEEVVRKYLAMAKAGSS